MEKPFITSHISKKAHGLEIGPSHRPIAAKKDGYDVKVVDHADQKGLIKKYKELNIETDAIEEVDYVWDGKQTLTELIGKPRSFDYIIASHVLEHTTDLVTFLRDCEALLKPTGKLCLAIPDKRYCFDYFRAQTVAGDVIDAFYSGRVRHTTGKVFDFLINSSSRQGEMAWSENNSKKLKLAYDQKYVLSELSRAKTTNEYIDIHNWMFTPASLKLLIFDLQRLGLIKLSYADALTTQGFEFFVILSKSAPPIADERINLLNDTFNDTLKDSLKEAHNKFESKSSMLEQKIERLEQKINIMEQSRRWRYTEVIAKAHNRIKGMK